MKIVITDEGSGNKVIKFMKNTSCLEKKPCGLITMCYVRRTHGVAGSTWWIHGVYGGMTVGVMRTTTEVSAQFIYLLLGSVTVIST